MMSLVDLAIRFKLTLRFAFLASAYSSAPVRLSTPIMANGRTSAS